MPIHLRENQYRGVNAHLQSFLQSPGGGWEMFHAAHITHLTDTLDNILPKHYYALNEKSLQLAALDLETEEKTLSWTRPDIRIHGEPLLDTSYRAQNPQALVATLPLIKISVEDEPLTGVLIFQIRDEQEAQLVTRIELLSPANKPPGSHYRQYLRKRNETLDSGINLVELDYLHETRFLSSLIPSYPDGELEARPYIILVNQPRPIHGKERTLVYGFHVDEFMPTIDIPLAGEDQISVDFGAAYNVTFSRNRYYGQHVDYEQLPLHFERYNPADQERIRERMAAVQARH
jgi:hypothetical protein